MRVVAAVLLLFLLCALPAHAQSGADVQLEIFPPDGGAPRTLAFSSLGEPDREGAYSLINVLRRAGVFAGSYDRVAVTQADGSVVEIRSIELQLRERRTVPTERVDDSTATLAERWEDVVVDRRNPVVLRAGAGGPELLRPAAPLAQNPTETVFAPVAGRLTLRAVADAKLVASQRTAEPGDTVTFVATPPPGEVYEGIQYERDFGDGQRHSGPEREITHVYEEGTRNAVVTFLRDGRVLGSANVTVYVADPAEQGGGNIDPDQSRPVRRDPRRRPDPSPGPAGPGPETGGPSVAPPPVGSTPPPIDTSSVPAPVDPVAPPPVEPEPEPRPEPRPRRRAEPQPEPEPVGETVEGYLLASASAAGGGGAEQLPADAPQELKDLARRPTEASSTARTLPTVAWVAIGLIALLALGWALEGRRTLPYWHP